MKQSFALGLAIAAIGVAGCASQQPVQPVATPTPVTASRETALPAAKQSSYVVKKGDSLWKIASDPGVLGDPFRWPLLFKANRDQIQDPDFIDASQDLNYKANYTADEIADAVKKAEATPKFEPRKQPRKVLPIQY